MDDMDELGRQAEVAKAIFLVEHPDANWSSGRARSIWFDRADAAIEAADRTSYADRIEGLEAATQLQALAARVKVLEGLLREAEVKLTDVQGAYATGQYAANLLARIRAALGESHD